MKFAAIASAAAALVAVTDAAACDVTSLQTLLTSPDTTTCATDSGYMVTSLATPTDAQMDVMCTSPACQSVLSQIKTLAPTECTLGTFSLYADLINPLIAHCEGVTSSTSGSSTGSSAAPPTTVGSTDGSTTPDTVAGSDPATPSTTLDGSSAEQTDMSSSASSDVTSASTSGSSGASMAAVSAGAIVAVVVATFF